MTPSITTSEPHGTGSPVTGALTIGAGAPRRAPASSYSFWSYSIGVEATMEITGSLPRGDRDREVLALLLGLAQVLGDVVHRHRLQGELAFALDLDAVEADVLLVGALRVVGVPGDDGGLVDVEAAVTVVEPEQGQYLEDVDVVALLAVLRPG